MRILFVVHQFMPDFSGGTERVTLNLARAAQADGNRVEVLTVTAGDRPGWRADGHGLMTSSIEGVPVTAIRLVEEPLALADALERLAAPQQCVLVDCLTLWVTNLLIHEDGWRLRGEIDALLETLPQLPGRILLVSNETGLGVVPMGELSRRYVDEAGWLHQSLAEVSERVVFTVAGLPMVLKGEAL